MRVGINLLYVVPGVVGGTETYAAGLLQGLAQLDGQNEYLVFVNEECADWPVPTVPNMTRVVCPVKAVRRSRRYLFEQSRLPALLGRYAVDVVHSLGYVGPVWTPCPAVVTVPDLNYIALRQTMPLGRRLVLGFLSGLAARRADAVVTISEFSKRAICETLRIAPEVVTVTHLGPRLASPPASADVKAVKERYGLSRPYLAAFGGSALHKNIPRLLAAFAAMDHTRPYVLVLLGHVPPNVHLTAADRRNVVATGYVPADHLLPLLSGADAFVLPSLFEGFGLPVLEAQQVGVPVVCSTAGALPEVAGEGAMYFDPHSVADMTDKMTLVVRDPALRAELRRKGLANVGRFSWESTAQKTLAVYSRVGEQGRRG